MAGKEKDRLVKTVTLKDATGEMKASLWGSAANKSGIDLGLQVTFKDSMTYHCKHNKTIMIHVNNADQVIVSTLTSPY